MKLSHFSLQNGPFPHFLFPQNKRCPDDRSNFGWVEEEELDELPVFRNQPISLKILGPNFTERDQNKGGGVKDMG